MVSVVRRLMERVWSRPTLPAPPTKSWENAQKYELDHAYGFMEDQFFVDLFAQLQRGELKSPDYVNPLLLREFFDDDLQSWSDFLATIRGKTCMDIGPCVFSPLATWDGIGEAIVIEPLGDSIKKRQIEKFGTSAFDGLTLKSIAADIYLPEFADAVDGAIYCRNMLDHTPNWPFVLSNISAYAAPGCHLLFWTDVDHQGRANEGHYDICSDISAMKRLVQHLGFVIQREFQDEDRYEMNWGCVALKK